ncbi:response regulator transcription factor [Paenibacillus alginolyticus]|uniref:Response regulator transcription factor n=1 Tax=Paenibacillus alginolyticus TaxID=59839 RepID=A0ABT4GE75_9BACL|nr:MULTISPECIES: response regulator transcription factor [Paenibacillus]MCY9667038.1 response regulator transcription factor [Paenibacillus alginolyticus]MCY9694474.1 response regulator transcription factor [Paenibacillus alginolyticus]MEC0142060.1 response regulator transcription factor [Paenibacillus alginolyticus]NRF94448.1 response regulator transcription factor [Paenibacillus frigoriresistens]
MPKILVVDDHAVVRSGLMSLLNGKHSMEVIGEAADGQEGIQAAQLLKPDVVLMDLNMPHGMDGLTATTELKRLMPDLAVLVLTMHDDDEYLFRAIHAGASGYILKSAPHEELLTAIRSVASGNAYLYPTATKRLMSEYIERLKHGENIGPYESLSEREKEVLSLIAKGFSNKEIAEQLIISVKTVESHKSNVMEKLGLKTRPELVKFAVKKGLLNFE